MLSVFILRWLYRPIFFFFNDTATTEIYTLSLHDALPICRQDHGRRSARPSRSRGRDLRTTWRRGNFGRHHRPERSEEHTSELQSRSDLVCRLLLEKKKKVTTPPEPDATTTQGRAHTLVTL